MINWGIIGLGRIAHTFANDLAIVDNAHLQAVASRSLERSKEFADQYNAPYYYGSYEEMINCPELDVVYVATPHPMHHPNTITCLQAGIPVLCEKPFAINLREAREMVKVARENQVFLMEAMWTRFLPHLQKAVEMINQGTIGKLRSVKANLGFQPPFEPEGRMFNLELGGGALLDIGVYPTFLSVLLFGKPDIVKAVSYIGTTNVDEDTSALFLYDDGQMAQIHSSIRYLTGNDAIIYGEKGNIHLQSVWNEASWLTLNLNNQAPQEFKFDLKGQGFYLQIQEVMNCLQAGKKESDTLPLDFSLTIMETLDRIRKSAAIEYPQDKS